MDAQTEIGFMRRMSPPFLLAARLPRWPGGLLVACLILLLPASAAFATAPPAKAYRLELKHMKGIAHGTAAVVKGVAEPKAHRFVVDGMTINTPVVVLVRPVRGSDSVKLQLTKYAWDQPLRQGEAQGKTLAFKFRTEGEFQLSVSASKPTPYRLLVWAGDKVKPELAPVVVKASRYKGKHAGNGEHGGGWGLVLWVIAAALAAGVILLAVLVFRRIRT